VRDNSAPPEHRGESQKDSLLLQGHGRNDHQANEARLEKECGILNRATGRRRLWKALMEDEVSFEG
jgi:hypothetical protein